MSLAFPKPVAANRYDEALAAYVPMQEPEAIRKARKSLMVARDLATVALSNPEYRTAQALKLYEVILDTAVAHAFRLQDLGGLPEAVRLCRQMFVTAAALDQAEGSDGL